MKNTKKLFGIIAIAAMIGLLFVGCDDGGGGGDPGGNPGGGTSVGGNLTAGKWSDGNIADPGDSVKYTFSVKEGVYKIWINNRNSSFDGSGTKTLVTTYSVSFEGGADGLEVMGTLNVTKPGKISVEVKPSSSYYNTGTFAIAYTIGLDSTRPSYSFNPPNASALIEKTWVDGEIVNVNDMIWYSFNVTSGQPYYFWLNEKGSGYGNGTKTLDVLVNMYYSDGVVVLNNIDTAWETSRSFTPTSDGKIYIRVITYSSSSPSTGTFGLVYSTTNARPSTINASSAIPLVMNEWKTGAITSSTKELLYSVSIETTGTYYFWWDDKSQFNDSNSLDIEVTAMTSNETNIFSKIDTAWDSSRSSGRVAGETIYLIVTPKTEGTTGAFSIVYSNSNTRPFLVPDNAVELVDGQWANGEIIDSPKKVKWYSFNVENGKTYSIWSNTSSNGNSAKDLNVTVNGYYANGETNIANASDMWATPGTFTSAKNGKVYLKVTPTSSSAVGTFGIVYSAEADPARPLTGLLPENPILLTSGIFVDGEISGTDSEAWYSFTAAASSHYLWWNDAGQGNGFTTLDVEVSVWKSNETLLIQAVDSAWNNGRSISLSAGEKIYIRVTPKTSGSKGTFNIVYSTSSSRPLLIPFDAPTLTDTQWLDGNITASIVEAWYKFDVTSGQTYYIWWNDRLQGNNTKTLDVAVSAYYTDGSSIFASKDDAWTTPQSFISTGDNTVFIKVAPYSSSYTGTFGIVYRTANSTRPPAINIPATPDQLTAGTWANGEITGASGEVWYSVTATTAGTNYFWWNDAGQGNGEKTLDVLVTVFRSNENAIFYDIDSAWRTYKNDSLSSNETVYIRVKPKTAGSTGTFSIVFNTSDTIIYQMPANAPALTTDQWVDGNILLEGSELWYKFNVTSGSTYYIWWNDNTSSKTLDVDVSAYFNDGTPIFTRVDSAWTTPQTYEATGNGTVYVRVHPYYTSGYTGTFGLVYTENSSTRPLTFTPKNPTALTADKWMNGEITSVNNEIWYTVTSTTSANHYFWWNDAGQGNGDKTLDVVVTMWRVNDTVVFSNQDSAWTSYRSGSIPSSETAFIRVTPKTAGATGTFSIAFNTSSTRPFIIPTNVSTLTAGQWTDGYIPNGGEQWFSFTATAATQYVHIKFGILDDVYVQLYNGDGSTVGSEPNLWSTTYINRTVTIDQLYYVRVRPYSSSDSGTYRITFNTSSTAPAQ